MVVMVRRRGLAFVGLLDVIVMSTVKEKKTHVFHKLNDEISQSTFYSVFGQKLMFFL